MLRFERMIQTIDAHTGGEPLRIVTSGLPPIEGRSVLEKRRFLRDRLDHLRTLIMLEPRGHAGMYGCIMTPPCEPGSDFGVIFMHNEGYSTMCGHGIIAVTKIALEMGLIESGEGERVIRIDSPAGLIEARARIEDGRARDVCFKNVPAFVFARDIEVNVGGLGPVLVDVAFGGAFYVYVMAKDLGVRVRPEEIDRLTELGVELKHKVMAQMEVVHPLEPELEGIYGTIICEEAERGPEGLTSKNVCIFADAQIDRSPTGTGTSGRLALLLEKGLIEAGENFINHSVIDTVFRGQVLGETGVGKFRGAITEVGGEAQVMGFNQLVLDPDDPLPKGFRLTGG